MSEQRLIQDADGSYYSLPRPPAALARAADGTYDVDEAALDAARLRGDEVAGYANNPIPGVDVIVRKQPGGSKATFTIFGPDSVPYGGSTAPRATW